ncbi:MAG: hypothetical protein HYU77_03425 [Betaproteobacteria bacterium]|nr:hypothetical protein [Betaproteobacteria bacterium]
MSGDLKPAHRLPLLVLGFLSLFLGIAAGLARLGWALPLPSPALVAGHGPLMVSGFFGTVIGLERAVALARLWAYLGPLLTGVGGLILILGIPGPMAPALMTLGSAVLVAASVNVLNRQRALFTLALALGAVSWMLGNLMWLTGWAVNAVVPWWIGFLVLTIAGERLELSRFLPPSPVAKHLFAIIMAVLLIGAVLSVASFQTGTWILGAALLALTLWLLKQDIARRTVKDKGLTRFIAVCLLSGYGWLAVAGATMVLAGGLVPGTAAYDAALHAVLLGFVFSMVFGHAPVIFPAVTRFAVPYHPTFYIPLAVLHLSLLLRLMGDFFNSDLLKLQGGAANGLALLLFVISTVAAVIRGRRGLLPRT